MYDPNMNDDAVLIELAKYLRRIDEDQTRYYELKGQKLLGVTSVLDVAHHRQLTNWFKKTSAKKIKEKSDAGKTLGAGRHGDVELYERGEKAEGPFIDEWKKFKEQHKIKVIHSEFQVCSSIYGCAGTADMIAEIDGKRTLCDLKTGKYVDVKAGYQCAAYAKMWHEWTGEELPLAIFHLPAEVTENYEPKLLRYEHVNFCFERFLACLEIYKGLYFRELQWIEAPDAVRAERMRIKERSGWLAQRDWEEKNHKPYFSYRWLHSLSFREYQA